MRSALMTWTGAAGWTSADVPLPGAQTVLVFGSRAWFALDGPIRDLQARHPVAHVLGCSTGGQIAGDDVNDDAAVAMVLAFDHCSTCAARVDLRDQPDAHAAGASLARALIVKPGLRAILLLSDGLHVNATRLVAGMRSVTQVPISGGLAGDGPHFGDTLVHLDGVSSDRCIAAVGIYGASLRIGHGSSGGWAVFGPRRLITRSDANVLLELDGRSALDLYRTYLGDEAAGLPGTGLLYPLMITDPHDPERMLVRTLLSVDEGAGSMTFAGDMPEGWTAQLMRGYFDRLARAAGDAAGQAIAGLNGATGDCAALMISCIGRRILMADNVITELMAARDVLGADIRMAGFYSYGEIAPRGTAASAELFNQTMTVTLLAEGPG